MTSSPSPASRARRLQGFWPRHRPAVMGIVNCTPDSFSDPGRHLEPEDALRHAELLLDQGAELIDVGGESTRPGSKPVAAAEECRRVVGVIAELHRRRPEAVISVDTSKAEVAAAGLEAGADVINDVTAAADPSMLELARASGAAIVLMHMRGSPLTMQLNPTYTDVVSEVHGFLRDRAAMARASGLPRDRVWLDPGIGFGKDAEGNLALLAAMPQLASQGHPILVGPSRKSFIGRLTGAPAGARLPGTLASLLPVLSIPRAVVRVHEAGPTLQFLEIATRIQKAS